MAEIANNVSWDDALKQKLIATLPDELTAENQKMHVIHASTFIARKELQNELDKKLHEYEQMHINNCDEIQYVVNGSVMFGFVTLNGKQSVLILLPGEKLFIKNTSEHWGTITSDYYATLITYRSVAYSDLIAKPTGTPVLVKI